MFLGPKINNSYKYSFTSVLFIPTISSESLNINLMEFIEFLNNNFFIIISSTLVLGLFILYKKIIQVLIHY